LHRFIFTLAVGESGRGLPLVAVARLGISQGAKAFLICRSVTVLAA
jgi:hypothetical protein